MIDKHGVTKSLVVDLDKHLTPSFLALACTLEQIGEVAYQIELPKNRPVFHISQLHKALGATDHRKQYTNELEWVVEPWEVVGARRSEGEKKTPTGDYRN